MLDRRIDFVVGGAQKAGTTTLDAYLRRHPAIGMARSKETHFFDDESRDWVHPSYEAFHQRFVGGKRLHGESTPVTLYWTPAQYRLREYNPKLKLILIFRDPIDRAFSNWRMNAWRTRKGVPACDGGPQEILSFSEAIRGGRLRLLDGQESPGLNRLHSYIERGFYGLQLRHLLKVFPREQLLYLDFQQLTRDPAAILDTIAEFLGVEPGLFGDDRLIENVARDGDEGATLIEEDVALLGRLFRVDLETFTALTGLDVSAWRSARYL